MITFHRRRTTMMVATVSAGLALSLGSAATANPAGDRTDEVSVNSPALDPTRDQPAGVDSADQPDADELAPLQRTAGATAATAQPSGATAAPTGKIAASRATVSGPRAKAPYGAAFPITLEANFSRPLKDTGTKNADFALLNDLERLIRGSYVKPNGKLKPAKQRRNTVVYASVSRMEDSVRVGRELVKAARHGVSVRFIHGKATQSPASKKLQRQLNAQKTGAFKICAKGRSLACLSSRRGAIAHTKIVMVSQTFTREGKEARGAVWTGSSNYGGRSAERTYNNGLIVYNDKKLWTQMSRLWGDMWAKRNIGNDYLRYAKKNARRYGYAGATRDGYSANWASNGMFYSNLSNFTLYATPIRATPTNGRDPVLNMLNRVVPDEQCRIRLQENRFKYRRLAVAYRLVELNDGGCRISAVAFKDDRKKNWDEHCGQMLRICKPILDVFKTARTEIETGYARPHDKTILVDAKLRPNRLNPEERTPDGRVWPKSGYRTKLVLSGSAALTGSNLVSADEVTTETTDPAVYEDYLDHYKAILHSPDYKPFKY